MISLEDSENLSELLQRLRNNMERVEKLYRKAEDLVKSLENCMQGLEAEILPNFHQFSNCSPHEHGIEQETLIDYGNGAACLDESAVSNPSALRLQDRVVWLINDQPEVGTVLWIGMMSDGLVAGVEFDEAIGNSDGVLDGKSLFKCRQRHGRFILVRELILWKDFIAN